MCPVYICVEMLRRMEALQGWNNEAQPHSVVARSAQAQRRCMSFKLQNKYVSSLEVSGRCCDLTHATAEHVDNLQLGGVAHVGTVDMRQRATVGEGLGTASFMDCLISGSSAKV